MLNKIATECILTHTKLDIVMLKLSIDFHINTHSIGVGLLKYLQKIHINRHIQT